MWRTASLYVQIILQFIPLPFIRKNKTTQNKNNTKTVPLRKLDGIFVLIYWFLGHLLFNGRPYDCFTPSPFLLCLHSSWSTWEAQPARSLLPIFFMYIMINGAFIVWLLSLIFASCNQQIVSYPSFNPNKWEWYQGGKMNNHTWLILYTYNLIIYMPIDLISGIPSTHAFFLETEF